MSKTSIFSGLNNLVAKHYGNQPGKMLIHTGVIGWILSSAAQVVAIIINDKIPKEQKMYLIPQEIADAGVNILSFYAITQTFKSVATKLVNTGKWLPGSVRKFLDGKGLANVGKKTFDVVKDGKLTSEIANKFTSFRDGIDVIATTIGSILSCNIVTPVIRNEIAANRQKTGIAKLNTSSTDLSNVRNINPVSNYLKRPSIQAFQSRAYTNSSSLKI